MNYDQFLATEMVLTVSVSLTIVLFILTMICMAMVRRSNLEKQMLLDDLTEAERKLETERDAHSFATYCLQKLKEDQSSHNDELRDLITAVTAKLINNPEDVDKTEDSKKPPTKARTKKKKRKPQRKRQPHKPRRQPVTENEKKIH